mgnify:CR=1 FL=1
MIGLIIGLLLANLIAIPLAKLPGGIGVYVAVLLNVALGYWGVRFFAKRGDDFWNILTNIDIKVEAHALEEEGRKPRAGGDADCVVLREDNRHERDNRPGASSTLRRPASSRGR